MSLNTLEKAVTVLVKTVERNIETSTLVGDDRNRLVSGILIHKQHGIDKLSKDYFELMRAVLETCKEISPSMLETYNIIIDDAIRYKTIGKNEYNRFMETVN